MLFNDYNGFINLEKIFLNYNIYEENHSYI